MQADQKAILKAIDRFVVQDYTTMAPETEKKQSKEFRKMKDLSYLTATCL